MRYEICDDGSHVLKLRGHVKHVRDRACPACRKPDRLTKVELANGYQCEECEARGEV